MKSRRWEFFWYGVAVGAVVGALIMFFWMLSQMR
jgi:hypothetical protein